LDHAVRWWGAEEENARRLMTRERLFVTVGLALIGLSVGKGVTAFGKAVHILERSWDSGFGYSSYLALAFAILLSLGAGLVLAGISYASRRVGLEAQDDPAENEWPEKQEETLDLATRSLASGQLGLDAELLASIGKFRIDPDTAEGHRLRALTKTGRAANTLRRLNERKKWRLDRGQGLFRRGLLFVIVAVAIYAVVLQERGTATVGYTPDVATNQEESP
jgi:hypothetical protein